MKILEKSNVIIIGNRIKIVQFDIIQNKIIHNNLANSSLTLIKRAF
jgi:hypothetical protein